MAYKRAAAAVSAGLVLMVVVMFLTGHGFARHAQSKAAAKSVTIGVIQITLTHGYQKVLNQGYKEQAAKMGANMKLCINNLQPGPNVTCAENLINGGAQVI